MRLKTGSYELMPSCLNSIKINPEINNRLMRSELRNSFSHCTFRKKNSLIFKKKSLQSRYSFLKADSKVQKILTCSIPMLQHKTVHQQSPEQAFFFNFDIGSPSQIKLDLSKAVRLNQMEQDLVLLQDQLECLTKNKNIIISVLIELQNKYQQLLMKNREQEREIQTLKHDDIQFLGQSNEQGSGENNIDLMNIRQSLGICEHKLNKLDNTMMRLLKSYQSSKENEIKYEKENQQLIDTNNELKIMLTQVIKDLEKLQKVNTIGENLREQYEDYFRLKIRKTHETTKSTTLISQSQNVESTQQITEKYEETVEQQGMLELKIKNFEQYNKQSGVSQNENVASQEYCQVLELQKCIAPSSHRFVGNHPTETESETLTMEREISTNSDDNFLIFSDDQYNSADEEYELECVCELCDDS